MGRESSYALVAGASTTMGAEFARQLASRGHSLVLVARRRDRLNELAARIREDLPVDVVVRDLDLLEEGAVDALADTTRDLPIDALVCNAILDHAEPALPADLASPAPLRIVGTPVEGEARAARV